MEPTKEILTNLSTSPIAYPDVLTEEVVDTRLMLNNFAYSEFLVKQAIEKRVHCCSRACFYFVFCWSESFTFYLNGKLKQINPLESCIIYDPKGSGIYLYFNKKTPVKFCVIGFNKPYDGKKQLAGTCYFKFKQIFTECTASGENYYKGKTNLKIFEKINAISQMSKDNVAEELMLEGMLFQVFGLKIRQMLDEREEKINEYQEFTRREIEQLHRISQYIVKNPGKEYTIDYLCRETGLGSNKLQQGFKKMYNRTVIDYIRHVRLEKALELIKNTDLSISEIVYTVGLSSRSYFSKIFKTKYNCSPKNFQSMQRSTVNVGN